MILEKPGTPLKLVNLPIPKPGPGQVLVKVIACGVCRTDLHVWNGELPNPQLPIILGHQVVGNVVELGSQTHRLKVGDRVGLPWLDHSCQACPYCLSGHENLCDNGLYRGYQLNGGFAEYCLAHEDYIFSIPSHYSPQHAAPLLCAGLIGFRSYRMAESAIKLGFFGFGSAAHILTQVALHEGKIIYAFTRKGDLKGQEFARQLGAIWAGDSDQMPPDVLDAAILFAPSGELVPLALQTIKKGGAVICAGIHMSDIPTFPYKWLYGERVIRSVTNLTRQDGRDFFQLAKQFSFETTITTYSLQNANQALKDLQDGCISGSAVIII